MRKSANNRYAYDEESEEESEQQSSDEEESRKVKRKGRVVIPRFIKNQIDEIDTEVIVVNVSRTQYEVVEEVAQEMGWHVERSKKSQKWDVMWIDSHIEAHDLFKLNEHQKISHFPAIYVLTRKNFLGRSLMKMNREFPSEYGFFPFTWSIPSDYTDLMRYDEKLERSDEEPQYYIFKPEAMAQGKGIKLYNNIELLDGKNGIVQTYINNPFLIENLKFDLRIYVLILGYDPLRIFIYDEGLGRFATEKYQKVGKKNMKDVHMHLTNYSLNKNNKNFIFNTSDRDMNRGHKRSLSAIYKYLLSKNVDVEGIKKRIDDMIIKTLIVGQPMIAHTYGLAQADSENNDLCFQILGFDVILDDKLDPFLLEVNHTPSFKTDTPLDKFIKKSLIKDTLNLLNLNVENKKEKVDKKKDFMEKRQQRKLTKMTVQEKQALRNKICNERNEYEDKNLGNFRKIFPIEKQSSKFDTMIEYSKRIFNEQYGFKNKGINLNRKMSHTNRPMSLVKKSSLQEKVLDSEAMKKKINLYDVRKTMPIKEEELDKIKSFQLRNSAEKFPTIAISQKLSDRARNFSGYMVSSVKSQFFSSSIEKSESVSPERNKKKHKIQELNLFEKISNQGNFIAPKVLEMSDPQSQLMVRKNNFDLSNYKMNSFEPTVVHRSPVKSKNIDQILEETEIKPRQSPHPKKSSTKKIMTYQFLINSLSDCKNDFKNLKLSQNSREGFQMKLNPIQK